jgi:copper transport protein
VTLASVSRPSSAPLARSVPRAGLLGGLVVAVLVALVALAAPASAHAVLEQSNPVDSSALTRAPTQVTLGFSEAVTINSHSVQVVDASGRRADLGDATHGSDDSTVVVRLKPDLPTGTYIVSWRVISADTHPVSGGFYFGIGQAPDAAAAAAAAGSGRTGSAVSYTAGLFRFTDFAGLALLLGSTFFLLVLWPAGGSVAAARRVLWTGWGLTSASAVLLILVQGPYSAGTGLSTIFASGPLSEVLHDRFGHLLLLRLLALALAVPLLRRVLGPGPRAAAPLPARHRGAELELGALALVTLLTVAAAGHAGAGSDSLLATVSTMAHVGAMAVWLGGLATLTVFLGAPRPATAGAGAGGPAGAEETDARWSAALSETLPRWSRVAMAAVGVLVLTGVYQAWREVGTLAALPATSYGKVLLVKVWLFALMLWLGWLGHRWVTRRQRTVVHAFSATAEAVSDRPAGPAPGEVAVLRRGVAFEAVIGLAVLAVTAVLVNGIPSRTSYAPPFKTTVQAGPLTVRIGVKPTTRGAETLTVDTADSHGKTVTLAGEVVQLSLPSANLGPLTVPVTQTGPGQIGTDTMQVPLPGVWQLRLTLRIDDFDQYVTTVFYTVKN